MKGKILIITTIILLILNPFVFAKSWVYLENVPGGGFTEDGFYYFDEDNMIFRLNKITKKPEGVYCWQMRSWVDWSGNHTVIGLYYMDTTNNGLQFAKYYMTSMIRGVKYTYGGRYGLDKVWTREDNIKYMTVKHRRNQILTKFIEKQKQGKVSYVYGAIDLENFPAPAGLIPSE